MCIGFVPMDKIMEIISLDRNSIGLPSINGFQLSTIEIYSILMHYKI
nr:MAG TPA: hypothetical protein [Caudoviricetes sp.]